MKKYALFVGIDISKEWIDVALSTNGLLKDMVHRRFSNELKGFKAMLKWSNLNGCDKGLVCMEHTGIYTLTLCTFLAKNTIDFILESPLRIKKSIGIKRGKDDKADAKDIARYAFLFRHELKISQLDPVIISQLKSLLSYRERLVKTKVQLQVPAKELKVFGTDHQGKDFVVNQSNLLLIQIKQSIKDSERQLKAILKQDQKLFNMFELLISIKGFGIISAITLIVHTNGFTAFSSWRKFAAYIGTAPFKQESGSSYKKPDRVSKLGHKKVKVLLSNSIMSAIQHDPQIRAYYLRKIEQGKVKYKVFNAIKNKLLARAFAVIKRGTPYVQLDKHYA